MRAHRRPLGAGPGRLTRPRHPADLKKYRHYEVALTAYNVIGESPATAPVEVFVGEAGKPRIPPPARGHGAWHDHAVRPLLGALEASGSQARLRAAAAGGLGGSLVTEVSTCRVGRCHGLRGGPEGMCALSPAFLAGLSGARLRLARVSESHVVPLPTPSRGDVSLSGLQGLSLGQGGLTVRCPGAWGPPCARPQCRERPRPGRRAPRCPPLTAVVSGRRRPGRGAQLRERHREGGTPARRLEFPPRGAAQACGRRAGHRGPPTQKPSGGQWDWERLSEGPAQTGRAGGLGCTSLLPCAPRAPGTQPSSGKPCVTHPPGRVCTLGGRARRGPAELRRKDISPEVASVAGGRAKDRPTGEQGRTET